MGAPATIEIRSAILRARKQGMSYEEIVALLGVSESTVTRILRRHRAVGSVKARPRGGGNFSPIRGRVAELLVAIITRMPDATVDELTEALIEASGTETSRSSVQRALSRLGYSRKKSPSPPASATRRSTRSTGVRSAR